MVKPKKVLALVLVLGILMSLFSTLSFAEEKTYGDFRYIEENGAVTITGFDDGGTGNGALNIPNEIDGLPVRSVSSNVCWNNNNLTSIHIPANLQSLDDTALRACYGVTKITVDENNPYFDSRNNCNAVIETATNTLLIACQRTVVPEGITTIGVNAYLRTAELPDSVTKLCDGAFASTFASTKSVKYIKLPANLLEIEDGALSRCLVSVFIPASVTHIGNYNFNSGSLQSVHYAGTQEQWKKITIGNSGNGDLSTANIHYESQGDPNAENVHGYQDIQSVTFGAYRPLYRGAEDSPFDCLKADILFSDNSTCTCVFSFSYYSDDEDYQYNNNGITYHHLHNLSFDVYGETSEVYFTVSGNPDTDDSVTVTINGLGKKSYTYNAQFELPVEDSPVDYIEILDEEIEVNIHSLQPDTRVGDGLYAPNYDRPVCIHFKDGSAMNTGDMYGGSGWGFDGKKSSLFVAREAPFPGINIRGNALYRLDYISNQSQQPWTTPGKYPVTVRYMGREAVYYVNVVGNPTSVNTGETKTFFIENNSYAQFSYTPEESGNYRIYFYNWETIAMQDHTVGVSINGESLSWQFDESHGERYYIEYTFEEGEQYLFSVSDSSPIDDGLDLPICIEKYTGGDPDDPELPYTVVDEGLIAAGQTKHLYIDNYEYHDFTFVPEADGYYEFSSSGDADAYATLSASDGTWYDDDGGDGYNFYIAANLTAGTQYTLRIAVYFNGDSDITVKKQRGIKSITYTPAEKIVLLEEAGSGNYATDEENKTYYYYNLENYHSDGFCSGDRLTIVYEDGTQTYTFSANIGWEAENGDIFTDRLQIEDQQEQQHWGVGKENVFYLQYRGIRSNPIPVTILPNSQLDDAFGYRVGENNTCYVIGYKGTQTQVSIPQTIQGYTVVGIDAAFMGNKTVTSIDLPDTLTEIGSDAFYGCEQLRQITIPDSVDFIGWAAFQGTAITGITIPEGVEHIEPNTFSHCSELKRVDLPNSLQYIGQSAFYSSGIERINLPKALDSIDYEAFAYCESLTEVDIPNCVTTIGNNAFRNCSGLTKVRLPDNLSYFGSAFVSCRKLTNVMIPEGVQSVEWETFLDTGLKEVVIPKSVTSIGNKAFGYTYEEHYDDVEEYYWYESVPVEGFTVKGYRGSVAQQYAVENGFAFVALDDAAVLYLPQLFNTQTSLTLKNGEREYCAESSTGLFILSDVSQEQAYNVFVNTKHSITACAATAVLAENGKWMVLSTAQLPAVGDVNGDGVIDVADISLLLSSSVYGVENSEYDLDNDGVVGLTDIAIVLQGQNYLKSSDVI